MKPLRKKLRESRLRAHDMMRSWLRPKVQAAGERCRLAARIRLANSWAAKHPKRMAACVVGALAAVFALNIAVDAGGGKSDKAAPDMGTIADIQPVFKGFHAIQSNKDLHQRTLEELAVRGREIRHELDSMIALPRKSHADSVEIVRRYRQLENIVKFMKNEESHD